MPSASHTVAAAPPQQRQLQTTLVSPSDVSTTASSVSPSTTVVRCLQPFGDDEAASRRPSPDNGTATLYVPIKTTDDADEAVNGSGGMVAQLDGFFLFLGVFNIFTDTALGAAVIPILPRALGLDSFHESVVLAVGAVTASLFGPICGWLSDAKGWAPTLAWFYPLVCTSSGLLISPTPSFWRFVIARLIGGVGSGVMYPSNLSMIAAVHHVSVRATAVGFTLAGDLGSLCGPLIGGLLYDWGGTELLYSIMLGLCVANALVFLVALKSKKRHYYSGSPSGMMDATTTPQSPSANVIVRRHTHHVSPSSPSVVLSPLAAPLLAPLPPPPSSSPAPSPEYDEEISTLRRLKTKLLSVSFVVRFLSLFYCWGVVVGLQGALPIVWATMWHHSAASIGLLFVPHLVMRVTCSAAAPWFSDVTGTPLHFLISAGILSAALSVFGIAITPLANPSVHSAILIGLGIGLGMVDSCVTAWAGNYEGLGGNGGRGAGERSNNSYHGRAFAVLALACDSGIFIVPLLSSLLSEWWSFRAAYVMFGACGFTLFALSAYCGMAEKKESRTTQHGAAA